MTDELEVLHCDNHLLGVYKPAGLPSVPDSSADESLFEHARAWIEREFKKPGRAFLGVVHRLDRPVSGVLLFARTSKAASRLSDQFRRNAIHKLYWGVCTGHPPQEQGQVRQWLVKDAQRNRVSVDPEGEERAGARLAITHWRVIAAKAGRSLLELRPESGRPHQLRVAAASWGAPLLGDLKYGAREPLPDRSIALHARSIRIEHPTLGTRLELEAPPPERDWWDFSG